MTTPGFNRWKACRHGTLLYNVHDRYVGRSLELYGEFSPGEADLFRQVVRPGDVVVEVGANIGAHTLYLAQLAGPAGRVVAFEPQRVVFQALCANMALNSVTNAHCHPRAVGRAPGTLLVPSLDYARPGNFGGLALGAADRGEPVEVTTLDALGLDRCHFLKIDVEGMELDVLLGADRTIRRFRPLLYVENDREEKSAALVRHLDALGYELYWHRPMLFSPDNFLGNPENVFGRTVSKNMFCAPRGHALTLQGFRPVAIPPPLPSSPAAPTATPSLPPGGPLALHGARRRVRS